MKIGLNGGFPGGEVTHPATGFTDPPLLSQAALDIF